MKNLDLDEASDTTGFQLCVLVLNILQDLCVQDLNVGQNGQTMLPGFLPNLLQCLTSLDSEQAADSMTNWEEQARLLMKIHLTRVILLSCGIIASQQNGVNILKGHRVIEQLFSTSIISECLNLKFDTYKDCQSEKQKYDLFLLCDCSVGIMVCLTILFQTLPFNPSFIKAALSLADEFDDHNGFKMLEKTILYEDLLKSQPSHSVSQCSVLEDEPIKVIGTFLTTLKVVRVNYIHYMKCVKRKHQKCSYAHYYDHHHDILGIAMGTKSELVEANLLLETSHSSGSQLKHQTSQTVSCLVSTCTQFLFDLMTSVVAKVTRLELLKTIYCSGICCCMNLDSVVKVFVKGMQTFSPAVRTFCADILNKIILEHFSGKAFGSLQDTQRVTCAYCDEPSDSSTDVKVAQDTEVAAIDRPGDSGIDSSEFHSDIKLTALYKVSRWRPIAQLKQLLFSENEELAISTAKHLMVLAIKGNPYLKAELFFSLYIYALESVKKREFSIASGKPSLSKSVQVHCLSALPFLLQANCVTKVFLSKKGVRKLCELLEDEVLRCPVLKIFEALVVLDEHRFRESKAEDRECPCPYEGGKVIDSFISELSKRSFSDSSSYSDDSCSSKNRINKDCVVLSKFSLPVLVDLWGTCAKLCLHSQVFISQFRDQQCLIKTEDLLIETLDILMSPDLIGQLRTQGSFEAEDSGMEGETTAETEKENQASFYKRASLLESLMAVIGACNRHRDVDVSRFT